MIKRKVKGLKKVKDMFPRFRRHKGAVEPVSDDSPSPPVEPNPDSNASGTEVEEDQAAPVDPRERDLWEEACESLPAAEKDKMKALHSKIGPTSSSKGLEELISLVKNKQKECEKYFWRVPIRGKEIQVRDFAVRILDILTATGNIAIAAAPSQAGAPWELLKIIMKIPAQYDTQMGALLGVASAIVGIFRRGQLYECAYRSDQIRNDCLEPVQASLQQIYATCITLLLKADSLFSGGVATSAFKAFLNPDEVPGLVSDLVKQEAELDKNLQAWQITLNVNARAMLSTGLTELSSSLTDARKDINAILSQLEEDTQIHFLNLISSIKHHDHHQNVTERRTNDTGSWLLETEEFDQWNKQSTSGVFWLEGTAGTGKTFLTSRVIDELRPSREGSRRYDGFAFFYCNHNEQNRIGLKSILMSFVRQLSTVAGHPSSMRDDLRVVCQAADKENSSLSLEDSKNQIMKSVNLYHQTILVLDALDECETDTRRQLIKFFAALVSQCDKTLKVFISSRPDDQSHAKLPHLVTFNLHQSGNKDDIERFLNVKLNELESERDVFKRKRSAIINELLEKSGGMFQWVALQIDQIAECVTLKAVQDRLSKLPEGIEAAYQEIYDNIERRHGKFEQEIAIRAFLWVVAACKPLTGQEILDAVSFNPDGNDIPRERVLDKKELSILCRNFLLEDSQGLWRFSHFSVVEYLRDRQQCNLGKAHLLAAKTCLIVLNSASQWEKSSDSGSSLSVSHEDCLDPPYNFSTYAGAFWMVHSKKAQDVEGLDFTTLTSHLESFLGRPDESSPQYRRWFQKLDNHKRQWFNADSHPNFTCQRYETRYALEQNLSPQSCSAPAACYFSLFSVLEDWWEDVDLVSDHAWMCDSGLAQTAALVGCLPIYEWISKKRGDLSSTAPDNYYNGSFTIACSEGHFELVTWLVRNGTEADEECHIYQKRNPLTAAALSGHYDIVKYLIEQAKADPNLKNDDNVDGLGTALAAASYIESFEVAELLTKKGAHVNLLFPGANHGSALAAASRGGKIEIVELLINKGADVNLLLPGGDHGSALAAASYGGNIETVELLINKGADVNLLLPGGDHGSALAAAASYGGNIETVELLINKGADVNLLLSDGNDGSALAAASFLGPIEIVELLINKGADLNLLLPNGICGSALATASFGGNIEVVELLIKKGADLNLLLPNGICGSALAAASHRGHIEIVELLINKGADVNLLLPSGKYGSALAAASQLGNVDCVRTLLASGADVNMKLRNGTWIHALQAAVAEILPGIDRFDLRWRSTAQVECDKLETTNLLRSHGASE